jgi:hypothetical protein
MTALAERQHRFMAVVHGDAPVERRLLRYREQARAGWHDALAATYPVVRRLVGTAFFGEACDRYAAACPSASGDLHAYGASFAGFIAAYAPAQPLPYLADMSRLEWALHEAAFAADAPVFSFAALATLPADAHERIVLVPHPATRMLETRWPLAAWWLANQPGRAGTPDGEAVAGRGVWIARGEGLPLPHPLDDFEWRVLEGCLSGRTLGAIADTRDAAAAALPVVLERFARSGAFAGFRLAS